jgi:hypothetical protein
LKRSVAFSAISKLPKKREICWADIFTEILGLSPSEHAIFTDSSELKSWFALYGYTSDQEAMTALASAKTLSQQLSVSYQDVAKLVNTGFVNPGLAAVAPLLRNIGVELADVIRYKIDSATPFLSHEQETAFLHRFGADPRQLVDKAWQNGDFNRILILTNPGTECDFSQTVLCYSDGARADASAFLRINLFVRLWTKLGWSMEELDRSLQAGIPKS